MKLFAYAFAGSNNSVILMLESEHDVRIEANRMKVLGRSRTSASLMKYLQNCELWERFEAETESYICVSLTHETPQYVRYGHLSKEMLEKLELTE